MITERIRDSIGYKNLDAQFPYYLTNLLADNQINKKVKLDFLNYIADYKKNKKVSLMDYALLFMRNNKFLGKNYSGVFDDTTFIRIKPKSNIIKFLKECFIETNDGEIERMINKIFFERNPVKSFRYFQFFLRSHNVKSQYIDDYPNEETTRGVKIDRFIAWTAPLKSTWLYEDERSHMDCRCGLGDLNIRKNKFLFLYKMDTTTRITKPTSFDAEFYEYFLPGGKTKTVNKCNQKCTKQGVDEFIHEPRNFGHIEGIYSIINES